MNAAFIDAIVENPDDEGRWVVYADWLIQQGHPRGELINFSLAVDRGVDNDELQQRARVILNDLEPLLSERLFACRHRWSFDWWRGFIRGASPEPGDRRREEVEALFADPHSRLLADLYVGGDASIVAPIFHARRRHLRNLALEELGLFADNLNDIAPNLEKLALTGGLLAAFGEIVLGVEWLAHGNLRTLEADLYVCPAVCTGEVDLPRLERLHWVITDDHDIARDGSIFDQPPPMLRHLRIEDGVSGTRVIPAVQRIADAALRSQLVSLELGNLSHATMDALCSVAPRFAHLEELKFGVDYVQPEDEGPPEPQVSAEFLATVERRLGEAMPSTNLDLPRRAHQP